MEGGEANDRVGVNGAKSRVKSTFVSPVCS